MARTVLTFLLVIHVLLCAPPGTGVAQDLGPLKPLTDEERKAAQKVVEGGVNWLKLMGVPDVGRRFQSTAELASLRPEGQPPPGGKRFFVQAEALSPTPDRGRH